MVHGRTPSPIHICIGTGRELVIPHEKVHVILSFIKLALQEKTL